MRIPRLPLPPLDRACAYWCLTMVAVAWAVNAWGCAARPELPEPSGFFGFLSGPGGADDCGFPVLGILAGICSILAVLSIVASAYFRVAPRTTALLVVCAVGCWTLRYILTAYLWLIALLAIVSVVGAIAVVFFARRAWLEERTGLDINRDGRIGDGPAGPAAVATSPEVK